ncbi:MAG: hypothetical protein KGL46_03715 [Hyphomicrobiales bacterium]|nr:hypothetical protein [Hyphomicrobiales bacterium]
MHKTLAIAGVSLGLVLSAQNAFAGEHHCSGNLCYQPQARVACVKPKLMGVIHRLANNIGPLEITAGCNGRHVRNSFHFRGMAIDFRPLRASQSSAMAHLRRDPAVGGVIAEHRGLVHVDIGDRGHGKYVAYQRGRHYVAAGGHYGRHRVTRLAQR